MSGTEDPKYTLSEGQPIGDPAASLEVQTSHGGGLSLLADVQLVETLAHFARERIPERSVHAKAAGAFGYFECTHDCSDLTDAAFLSEVGKKTDLLARISTVGGARGSADTLLDIRGFSIKMYTEEGNQDFVFNDLPVFFLRDPIKFPSMNRSHKQHPRTNIPDQNMFWDYHVNNQEGIHALMQLFGGRGIPATLHNLSAFGVHTHVLYKEDGSFKYVKWHITPDAGIKVMESAEATKMAGENPDYHVQELFDAIERGDHPTWTVNVQVMDPKDLKDAKIPIFDPTYVWPHKDYPLRPLGKLTLDKNPDNYFQDIEQAVFSPSNMVPGVGPSADTVLQARIFSYPDAGRYRVGPNYQQLPPNRPHSKVYNPFSRDGPATINGNYGSDPDYVNSELRPLIKPRHRPQMLNEEWRGKVVQYSSEVTDKDFEQSAALWKIIKEEGADEAFLATVSGGLGQVKSESIKRKAIDMFGRVDAGLAKSLEEKLGMKA